jgi:GPH family glycoside/pentoside/hexuronide:cation symporter
MFYFGFTLVSCPYLALLPEIVRSDRDRVGLAALQAVFNVLGDLVGAVVGGILIGRMGFMGMGLFIAGLSALTFVLGLLGPRDDPRQEPPPVMGLGTALGHTFRNRHFVHYGLAFLTFWIGLTVVVAAVPFLVSELLHRGEAEAGVVTGVVLIAAVACLPLTTWASARWGKRRTFLASLLWFTALAPFLGTVGRWPVPLDGYAQAIVLMVLAGPPVSGLLVLPYALLAEVTDDDERVTGTRREATYFGVNGMLYKGGLALGGAVAAWVFAAFGKTAAEPVGLYLAGPVAGAFALVGWALFLGYGLPARTGEAR